MEEEEEEEEEEEGKEEEQQQRRQEETRWVAEGVAGLAPLENFQRRNKK